MLNKQKGNMYGFVTHTWNPIKGKCPHNCSYCYMKELVKSELHLDEKDLTKTHLGSNNYIFIGSSTDMFANEVPKEWIFRVLGMCRLNENDNTFLFQTKNPMRFLEFEGFYPKHTVLCITIETNRDIEGINCPQPANRALIFSDKHFDKYTKMITIEPILDFDVPALIDLIQQVHPKYVNIGADSKKHNLKEPSIFKIENLITGINKMTNITLKENLHRLGEVKNG